MKIKRTNKVKIAKKVFVKPKGIFGRGEELGIYLAAINITTDKGTKICKQIVYKERGNDLHEDNDVHSKINRETGLKREKYTITGITLLKLTGYGIDD